MIVGAGRYVLNEVIARDFCIETVEEFIQRIARRMFDIADQGPYEFLRTSHQCKKRRRAADPSLENYSEHLLPNSRTGLIKRTKHTCNGLSEKDPPPDPSGPYPRREDARA
ncbi:hypothetical protein EVAR_96630_1 [Eumeta japonica]|uniref:Uncharacterized protein n=1 Tax=Eumeta variegata TaxID=151549 RepID=A0A4C1WTN7_EUMVA|nr:hypothetical protein EVAR_96630_1 [Eumeta japonica]